MGKNLDANSGGPEPSAKPGKGGDPSPCRAFYMITPGIIHVQRVVRYKRIPPAKSFTHSQFIFGAGNSDTQRYLT